MRRGRSEIVLSKVGEVLPEVYGMIAEVKWVHEQSLQNLVVLLSSSTRALLKAAQDGVGFAIAAKFQGERYNLIEGPTRKVASRQAWLASHRETRNVSTNYC